MTLPLGPLGDPASLSAASHPGLWFRKPGCSPKAPPTPTSLAHVSDFFFRCDISDFLPYKDCHGVGSRARTAPEVKGWERKGRKWWPSWEFSSRELELLGDNSGPDPLLLYFAEPPFLSRPQHVLLKGRSLDRLPGTKRRKDTCSPPPSSSPVEFLSEFLNRTSSYGFSHCLQN